MKNKKESARVRSNTLAALFIFETREWRDTASRIGKENSDDLSLVCYLGIPGQGYEGKGYR